jgi:hypothetical protein
VTYFVAPDVGSEPVLMGWCAWPPSSIKFDLLDDHASLDLEYLNAYIPNLQVSGQACDCLFGRTETGRIRRQWELQIAEQIIFPRPWRETGRSGFRSGPGKNSSQWQWREPSDIEFRG